MGPGWRQVIHWLGHLLKSHDQRLATVPRERGGYMGGYLKPGPLPIVMLRPRQSASALLQGSNFDCNGDHACQNSWGISVRLPGQASFVRVQIRIPNSPSLGVTPLVAGLTGGHY